MIKNRKWIMLIGIALLVAAPVAIKMSRGGKAKAVEAQQVSARVLSPSILASGTLVYESEVRLVSEVIGRVQQILVREGDQVTRGQLLLRLDPATALAEIARLQGAERQSELNIQRQQVSLASQQAKWKRYQALRTQGIVDVNTYEEIATQRDLAQVELDTSRALLQQSRAQMKEARERLAKTELRSPINGKVTAVFIEAGETAVPSANSIAGSDLMIVADTKSLYAEINVDETDVARVGVGQEAKIVPAAFPDKAWSGTVEQVAVSPRQNPGQSKSYPVKIRLAASTEVQFHPGMSCRAEVTTRSSDASKKLAVPVQAVRYDEADGKNEKAKASVFVIVSGKARQRDVETGIADDEYIEITSGVQESEQIVIGPSKTLRFLREGEQVAVEQSSSSAVAARGTQAAVASP